MTDEKQIEYYYISKVVPIRQRSVCSAPDPPSYRRHHDSRATNNFYDCSLGSPWS